MNAELSPSALPTVLYVMGSPELLTKLGLSSPALSTLSPELVPSVLHTTWTIHTSLAEFSFF